MEEGEKGREGQEDDDSDIPDLVFPPACLHTPTWLPPSHQHHSTSAVSPGGT